MVDEYVGVYRRIVRAHQWRRVTGPFSRSSPTPDDERRSRAWNAGPAGDAGVTVILICASRGERGAITGPARDDQLAPRRALEAREAAAVLGIAHLIVLDHPDGDLQWAHVTEFHAEIVMALRRYDPAAVITFGEDQGCTAGIATMSGCTKRATTAVRSLGALALPLLRHDAARRYAGDRRSGQGRRVGLPEGLLESGARRLRPRRGDARSGGRRR